MHRQTSSIQKTSTKKYAATSSSTKKKTSSSSGGSAEGKVSKSRGSKKKAGKDGSNQSGRLQLSTDRGIKETNEKKIQDAIKLLARKCGDKWSQQWSDGCKAEAEKRDVSLTTLRRRAQKFLVRGTSEKEKSGPKRLLTTLERDKLKEWIDYKRTIAETPTTLEIKVQVCDILERRGVDARDVSDSWVTRFCQENDIVTRQARTLAQDRSGVTQMQIASVFDKLEKAGQKGKDARYIVNWDEGGFHGFHGSLQGSKVRVSADHREMAYRHESSTRQHVTLVLCTVIDTHEGKAWACPDLWVFPATFLNTTASKSSLDPKNWQSPHKLRIEGSKRQVSKLKAMFPKGFEIEGELPLYYVATSPSGNVNTDIVYNHWKRIISYMTEERGIKDSDIKCLMGDNHSTHIHPDLIDLQEKAGYVPYWFAPHSTHLCQFLDLVQMGILKREGRKCINAWCVFLQRLVVFFFRFHSVYFA